MTGHELDRKVAEVMGCTPRNSPRSPNAWECGCEGGGLFGPHNAELGTGSSYHLKEYSEEREYVGEMLEWAASKGLYPSLTRMSQEWKAELAIEGEPEWGQVMKFDETPQLALARAICALEK